MARVLALIPDLMFGSRVQGSLGAAGHEVELIGDPERLGARLADSEAPAVAALVVDLTVDARARARAVDLVIHDRERTAPGDIPTLAFYSHVDTQARAAGEAAGFDVVVARSRMAREGAQLVARLLSAG